METGLVKFETVAEIAAKNKPVIADKIEKMLAALSAVKTIDSEESDKYANDVLVKCNATLPVIEGLRKEYTSVIDVWKRQEMEAENKVKDEIDRIRNERNRWKTEQDKKAKAEHDRIEKQKAHDLEIEKVKAELVAGMELAVAEKIANGDAAIATMFAGLTLETIGQVEAKLNFEPTLKPELYNNALEGFDKYNRELVTAQEVADIKERFKKKFDFESVQKKYVGMVREVQKKWIAKIPARKKQLEDLAKADETTKAQLAASIQAQQKNETEQAAKDLSEKKAAIGKKVEDAKTEAVVNTEFAAQAQKQAIAEVDGVRKKVVYRFADEDALINDPLKLVQIMSSVIAHVATDKQFLGVYKRTKDKIPKKDPETGQYLYIDEVQGWLDELAKIKPSPVIPGLTATEALTSVASAKK